MRRILLATALVAVVAAGATTLAASSSDGSNGKKTGKTLFLTERADQAAPPTANAVGTRFTFSSVVYDQRGNRVDATAPTASRRTRTEPSTA